MTGPNTYKVFLASSYHLKKERDEIQKAFNALNDVLNRKKAYLELVLWEKLDAGNHPERKQSFYNEQLSGCHILIMLYQGQIGGFTKEEYLLAETLFRQKQLPRIYLFKKTSEASYELNPENVKNLQELEQIFYEKGKAQWPWEFDHYEGAVRKLNEDILRLFEDPNQLHFKYGEPAKLLSLNGVNDPTVFMGREDELKEIEERLGKEGSLLLVNAEGGIGKTTLAARYWNNTLYHYQYHAWLFCANGILNALTELAPALGVDLTGLDENQQLKALKQGVIQKQDGFLLVLDNANEPKDLVWFNNEFQGLHWHVLVTSRCNGVMPKEKEMAIEHLPPALAKDLFKKYYTEDTPEFETLVERLLAGLHYHTLCIELFAKTMQELSTRGETLQHLVNRLEAEGLFLGARSFEIVTDYTTQTRMAATNSDQILDRFYNFAQLEEAERYWLVNMALLPAEEYAFTFLCKIFGQDPITFNMLQPLAKRGWLNEAGGKIRISPVIQKLALKKNEATLGIDTQNLLNILNEILESDAYNFLNISLEEAEQFIKPVYHLTKCLKAFPSEYLANYNFYCGLAYQNTGNLVAASESIAHYSEVYKKLINKEPENLSYKNGLAISYSKLGGIYEATGDWQNALLNYQEYFNLSKEIYEISPENLVYKFGLAISFGNLGGIYEATGDWKKALLNYQEGNRLCKEIYESSPENLDYKNGLALSYLKLGGIYEAIGDWKKALLNYEEQLRLFNEIYKISPETLSYKNGLAISYVKIGGIYEEKKDWKNSLLNYHDFFRITKEIYEISPKNLNYKSGLAASFGKLGGIYEKLEDWNNAAINYQEYLRITKEIYEVSPEHHIYKNILAISYSRLGGAYEADGDWKRALQNFQEASRILEEIYDTNPENPRYKIGLAISYARIAILQEKIGEFPNDLSNLVSAIKLLNELSALFPENPNYQKSLKWANKNYERLRFKVQ